MDKQSFLLVEDHALIGDIFIPFIEGQAKLKFAGVASDTEEALDLCRKQFASIVIIDLNTAPNTLLELVHNIHALRPNISILVISPVTLPAYVRRILKMGAMAVVTKSSPSEELLFAITEAIARRKYLCRQIKEAIAETLLSSDDNQMTNRELHIMTCLKKSYSSKQIAEELNVKPKTVEGYRHKILKKLKLKNSLALIQYIHDHGL